MNMSVEVDPSDKLAVKDVKRAGIIVWSLINNPVVSYWEERIGELEELVSRNYEKHEFLIPLTVFSKSYPRRSNGASITRDQEKSLDKLALQVIRKYNVTPSDSKQGVDFHIKRDFIEAVVKRYKKETLVIYSLLNDCSFDRLKNEYSELYKPTESYHKYHYFSCMNEFTADTVNHEKEEILLSEGKDPIAYQLSYVPVGGFVSTGEGFLLLKQIIEIYQKNGYDIYDYINLLEIAGSYCPNPFDQLSLSDGSQNVSLELLRKYYEVISVDIHAESNLGFSAEDFLKMPVEWQWETIV